MQRIWILSELYYPEQAGTGHLLTQTAEGLADEYDVKVLTGPATNFFRPETSRKYEKYEERNHVGIYRCAGTTFNKDSLAGRLINLLTRTLAIFWQGLRLCKHGEPILVVTNPPSLPFVALLLKKLKGCPFIFLVHDVFPEAMVASGMSRPSSPIVRIGQTMNRILYKGADRIITLGRDMTKLAQSKLPPAHYDKIDCIPNWAETDLVHPTDRAANPLLKELNLENRFVLLYAGTMGKTHGIEYLASAARQLQSDARIHFLFLGFGAKQKWLVDFVQEHKLDNVTLLPPRPRSDQNLFLNACDAALISYNKGMAGISVPSRMYSQMAAGKPTIVVSDDWSEVAQVVKEEDVGWVVEPDDVDGLVKVIQYAADHPETCAAMGARAAAVACSKYSFEKAIQSYKAVFAAELAKGRPVEVQVSSR